MEIKVPTMCLLSAVFCLCALTVIGSITTSQRQLICRPGRAISNFTVDADGVLQMGCAERLPEECEIKRSCKWKRIHSGDLTGCRSFGNNYYVRGVNRPNRFVFRRFAQTHALCCAALDSRLTGCTRLKLYLVLRSFEINPTKVIRKLGPNFAIVCTLKEVFDGLTDTSCWIKSRAKAWYEEQRLKREEESSNYH